MKRLMIVLALAGLMAIPGVNAVNALQSGPSPTVQYVVAPGDTLWEIAGQVDGGRDRRAVVHDLMELNELRSATLVPGQTLRLPA